MRSLFNRRGVSGMGPGRRQPPGWLLGRFMGFLNMLDRFVLRPWGGGGGG